LQLRLRDGLGFVHCGRNRRRLRVGFRYGLFGRVFRSRLREFHVDIFDVVGHVGRGARGFSFVRPGGIFGQRLSRQYQEVFALTGCQSGA
jgi:hypothetical protein